MAAFKAANPGAVLEDFVRWHSPRDWLTADQHDTDGEISGRRKPEDSGAKWPPQGRLSKRMSQPDNVWAQIWEHVAPEPASEQKLLFDYKREGEKVSLYIDL
jgi:Rab3 GTPase-activating protein catalytic subunit